MSAAVFAMRSSLSRLAVPTRWLTPAGTASRAAKKSSMRRVWPGSASSVAASSPASSRRRQKRTTAESGASGVSASSTCAFTDSAVARGNSSWTSRIISVAGGIDRLCRRSTPSSSRIRIERRSMCSIADTSIPRSSRSRRVASEAPRSLLTNSIPAPSVGQGTNATATVGVGASARNVTRVTIPTVPSEPMNRSMRSMSRSA